jgi:DNA repair exonuclease SbcCD ATPase subunit
VHPNIQVGPNNAAPAFIKRLEQVDHHARIAWLEQQYKFLFKDNFTQFANVQRLLGENQALKDENQGLKNEIATLRRCKTEAHELKASVQEHRWKIRELEDEKVQLDETVTKQKERLEKLKADKIDLEKQRKLAENRRTNCSSGSCRWPVRYNHAICPVCFMPVKEDRTMPSKKLKPDPHSTMSISDSEEERIDEFASREQFWDHPGNLHCDTRLEPEVFEWLAEWCEENEEANERQRAVERAESKQKLNELWQEMWEINNRNESLNKKIAMRKKERRRVKRQMASLTDEQKVVSDDDGGLPLRKKLYLFCRVMGWPEFKFRAGSYPFVKNERELVL